MLCVVIVIVAVTASVGVVVAAGILGVRIDL